MTNLYIGLMSGTSLDGVDVALCKINSNRCELISSLQYPFEKILKDEVLNAINGLITLKEVGELDVKLGILFASAINKLLKDYDKSQISAIGLHGQTLWHEPSSQYPFSMQLGSANIVSQRSGIKVVTDFRNIDIANGGQGAPLAPAFHQFLFKDISEKTAVVNIGGMANITILEDKLRGWDIGCGNVLMDMWIQKCQGKPYDKGGEFAKDGKIDEPLLKEMLDDVYFKRSAPKSTGREYFNENFLGKFLPIFNCIEDSSIQRTLLELTATTIANDVKKANVSLLIICGGGSKNSFLMQRIRELASIDVKTSDEHGVSSDFLEAMAFAWYAYKRVKNEAINISSVTGAFKNSILGAIYG